MGCANDYFTKDIDSIRGCYQRLKKSQNPDLDHIEGLKAGLWIFEWAGPGQPFQKKLLRVDEELRFFAFS